jgi:hypothetical protein
MGWESGHTLEGGFFFGKPKKKEVTNPNSLQISGKLAGICQWALMQSDWGNHTKIKADLSQNLQLANADHPNVNERAWPCRDACASSLRTLQMSNVL